MKYYTLDREVSGEKILKDINKLVSSFRSECPDKIPILCIEIKSVGYDDTDIIPKLEYKPEDSNCIT